MKLLCNLQDEVMAWVDYNFPGSTQGDTMPLLGVMKKVGQLSDSHIRTNEPHKHDPEKARELKKASIGDIVIYLADYCNQQGLDLDQCVEARWVEVRARDWKAFPKNGLSE